MTLRINSDAVRRWLEDEDKNLVWLAEQVGIGIATLKRALLNQGNPTLRIVAAIATVTGLPVSDLIQEDRAA